MVAPEGFVGVYEHEKVVIVEPGDAVAVAAVVGAAAADVVVAARVESGIAIDAPVGAVGAAAENDVLEVDGV